MMIVAIIDNTAAQPAAHPLPQPAATLLQMVHYGTMAGGWVDATLEQLTAAHRAPNKRRPALAR